MIFKEHLNLSGQHAFLSGSKYHWINYDDDRLIEAYSNYKAVSKGVILHDFAKRCIELKQKLPRSKQTLNSYVNDAIGFGMKPEQVLYYSDYCFGTADAISFDDKTLRIHDLKTGKVPAHMEQLEVYAAIFCLEYKIDPKDIAIILRIYQSDDINEFIPMYEDIRAIMNRIIAFNKLLLHIDKTDALIV